MKQQVGTSHTGDLAEAVKAVSHPSLLILLSNQNMFKEHVKELERLYPGIPSIGCACASYGKTITVENGVTVIAFSGCAGVAVNVIEELSSMPVKYISRVAEDIGKVRAEAGNTVCIDLATGNDSRLMTTLGSLLEPSGISLIGSCVAHGLVSCNGVIYEDACVYALVKNTGTIKTYKETIFKPIAARMVVTKADSRQYRLYELNGKPAEAVYCQALRISPADFRNRAIRNPLGKWVGDEFYIVAVQPSQDQALQCYKRIGETDLISILELDEYQRVVADTVAAIRRDIPSVSGVFSINCIARYDFFQEESYWSDYLTAMNFAGNHAGIIAIGEHYNSQYVNQTMVCVAFD